MHARIVPAPSPYQPTRHATALDSAILPAPRAAPINAWAAMANESSSSAVRFHSCMPIWCAASCAAPIRPATPAAVRYEAWKATARSTRSRLMISWRPSTWAFGRTGTRSRRIACRHSSPPSSWPITFATADPSKPRPAT